MVLATIALDDTARPRVGAIVAAAGESRRMAGTDKIFLPLMREPLISYSIKVLQESPQVDAIVLALSPANIARGRELVEASGWDKVREVYPGGERRQDSVRAGVERLADVEWVIVQDGARPFIDADMVARGLAEARLTGAAVAAVPVKDTIKSADAGLYVDETLPRDRLWAAQTPQVFRRELLAQAHDRISSDVNDDALMVERLGARVRIFLGSHANIKVTTPEDVHIAEAILRSRESGHPYVDPMTPRSGIGIDVHPLVEGRALVLGGVSIPFHQGLAGHSDGDVLLHAVVDALLGGAGLGDIGTHFPSGDDRYEGIASTELLRQTLGLLADRRWRVTYVDATILAERPRLSPFMDEIKRAMASALQLESDCVNVKATTTDGLGSIGRGEGIAALAVATVEKAV